MENHLCCPTDRPAYPGKARINSGTMIKVAVPNAEAMNCYVSGTSNNWIVVIYDIFGIHTNKFELADTLATRYDLSVAVPDVRRGKNWPINLYPPPTPEAKEAFYKYLDGDANPVARGVETRACIDYLRTERKCASVALLGLCWGAKVCSLVDAYAGVVKCVVGAHPSFLKSEDAERTTIPTLMLPTKEDNLTAYLAGVLRNKHIKNFTISENFLETFHGFLGARGQWDKPEERVFVDKAIKEIGEYVMNHV